MKTNKIISAIFMAMLMIVSSVVFTGCKKEDWGTDQFSDDVKLLAYGPVPVARGGQLRFIGSHIDQVSTVTFPNCATPVKVSVVSETEVRCVVPQEAQPGYPVLNTKDGKKITAQTRLTFTEPVGFSEEKPFSVDTIKPGKELTINGEYLNLVQKVIFTDKVEVAKFVAHERDHITLVVPAEAQTGKVTLSFCATGDTIPNEIASAKRLAIVLPSVKKLAKLDESKPGDNIVIAGEDFDLVTDVKTPEGASLEFAFNADKTAISFVLPQDITPGAMFVVAASGVEVPVATIGVALPNELTMAPATGVRAGDVLTITGKDLDVVTNVTFVTIADGGTVDAEVMAGRTPGKIQVTVPESAVSGAVTLNTAARVSVGPAEEKALSFETLKPAFKYFAATEVALGQDMVIYGQNMDLVVKATMTGGAKLEAVASTPGSVTFTLPYTNAETGTVELFMANGESIVTNKEISIVPPVCCYVVKWPELVDDELVQAGTVLLLEVANRDKLTEVQIDGEPCEYINSGETKIYVGIPSKAGASSKVKLISSNGEIEYDYAFKPNTEQNFPIWKGLVDLGSWSINWEFGKNVASTGESNTAFVDMGLQPGDIIRVGVTTTADWWQIQFYDGHWTAQSYIRTLLGITDAGDGHNINTNVYDLEAHGGFVEIVVDAQMVSDLTTLIDWGACWIIQGEGAIINKIEVIRHISLENTVWKGPAPIAGWANWEFGKGEGESNMLFVDAGVKKGSIIRLYLTTEEGWGFKLYDGHWGGFAAADFGFATLSDGGLINAENSPSTASTGYVELPVSADVATRLTDPANLDWNIAFVIQGDFCTLEKITVE